LALALAAPAPAAAPQQRTPAEEVSVLIARGQYAAAERIALAQLRREAAEDSPRSLQAAFWQNRLGQVAQLDGRHQLALDRFRLAFDIRRVRLGRKHGDTLIAAGNLSLALGTLGRWREAEPLLRETLAGNRRLLGDTHPRTVTNMTNLGLLCMDLGRQEEARILLEEALAATRKVHQPRSTNLATSLSNLAALYISDMDYARAEPLLDEALANDEARFGKEHPAVAATLSNLGQLYHATGRHADADEAYQRALSIDASTLRKGHPLNAGTLVNLAALHRDTGDLQKARKYLADAQDIVAHNTATGSDPDTLAMATFAELLSADGRHAEAQALLWKTISIIEARLGAGHPATAPLLMQLADTRFSTRSNPKTLAFKAHEIIQHTHGIDSARAARSALAVTRILIKSGNTEDALTWASQVRTQVAIHFGTASFDHAVAQHLFATAAFSVGRNNEAEAALAGALPALEQALPAQAESAANAMVLMSRILKARNDTSGAFTWARKAARVIADMTRHDALRRGLARDGAREGIVRMINLQALEAALDASLVEEPATRAAALSSAFTMADTLLAGPLQKSIARGILGTALISGDTRTQVDTLETRLAGQEQLEARYSHALATGAPAARIASLREELKAHLDAVSATDSELQRNEAYRRFLQAPPASLDAARKTLREGELLVIILPLDKSHIVLAASKTKLAWHRLPVSPGAMQRDIDALRAQLDPTRWKSTLSPFSRAGSHRLYQSIFGPVRDMMRTSNRLALVVAGPLRSLPFATLVTRPVLDSERTSTSPATLRETPWLVRSHTIATYPSLSSFIALRQRAPTGAGKTWRITGVGAPVVPDSLKLAPLPRAREELEALRKLGQATLLVGAAATEDGLQALDLSKSRLVAFATHALMPSAPGAAPALVLTPSEGGDGRLDPAGIAGLRLNGSLVVLSACNTAGSGSAGADMLAEAFFRAGASAVMHSHWPVFDGHAAALTALAMARYREAPGEGEAAALRKAMLATLADKGHPLNAHPATWAAFSVVGEVLGR